jgi:hypothetical protein
MSRPGADSFIAIVNVVAPVVTAQTYIFFVVPIDLRAAGIYHVSAGSERSAIRHPTIRFSPTPGAGGMGVIGMAGETNLKGTVAHEVRS